MKLKQLLKNLILICFLFLANTVNGQFKSRIQVVIDETKYKNGNLIVKYNINNAKNHDKIRVWIDVFDSRMDTVRTKNWKGDVNKYVTGGGEKVAIWNVFADELELIDSVRIKISATVENRFYLDDPLILSTIYPGWGDYRIKQKKPYWIYGATAYTLLGASVLTYFSASNNYDSYLSANSITDKNNYYDKAVLNRNLSYVFLGAAGVVWAIDYFGLIKRKRKIKKDWKKNLPVKETPNIPSFKIVSALSEKEFVNTSLTTLQVVENSIYYKDKDENYCLDAFEKGYIEFKLLNHGPAVAKSFYAKLESTDTTKKVEFPDSVKVGTIGVNQQRVVRVPVIASKDIVNGSFVINVKVSAAYNNPVEPFGVTVNTCKFKYQEEISEYEFPSDIDSDIPKLQYDGQVKFALIIGNEGYANEKTQLSKNFNVPYARHDALTFKKYAKNVLGVKEENIVVLLDATKKEMRESILTISDQVGKVKHKAELIFYYAGHGLADTNTLAPYLMPVDISPNDLHNAISLEFLYKKIWESRSAKSMVVLDASFNNGGRRMGLRGPSARKINPRREVISGNTVVFNAVSERYTANVYEEMRHGLFTYYFLKVLQQTRGKIEYLRLANSVKANVSERAIYSGKEQVPIALVSVAVRDIWQDWYVR
jgi:hypothetical protein